MAEDNFPKSKFEIKSPKIDVGTLMVSFLNSKNKKKTLMAESYSERLTMEIYISMD